MVSIIIPVYNTDKYLSKCLDSIVNQTLTDIEIIIVNDGSTDKSATIVDEYAKRDSRIITIHQKNAGQSSARNAGLDIATGEYIGFVDADDWVDINMYEFLYAAAKKYDADIAVCGRKGISESGNIDYVISRENQCSTLKGENLKYYFLKFFITKDTVSVCNKIYRKVNIDNLKLKFLPVSDVGTEDTLFNYSLFFVVNSICSVDNCYHYSFARSGSTARTYSQGSMQRLINLLTECGTASNYKDADFIMAMMFLYFLQVYISRIKQLCVPGTHREAMIWELSNVYDSDIFRKNARRIIFDPEVASGMKEWGFRLRGRIRMRLFLLLVLSGRYNLAIRILGY